MNVTPEPQKRTLNKRGLDTYMAIYAECAFSV